MSNYETYNRLVKNKRLILSIPLLLASLFLASHAVPLAHAQFTGKVCIVYPSTASSCSATAPTLGPFTVGQTFTVGVFIQGSDAMGGFDIYVRSDPTYVTPVSAALGPLIVTPSLTSICVNGSAQTGSCTVGTANGAGVVEVTTIEGTGVNECGGISPCSGLAFTITYSVVGATPTTTLSYPTATGCATSSVLTTNTCVLVDDSVGTTLPETIQGAAVSIVLPQGVVCIIYPTTVTSCPVGKPTYGFMVGQTVTVGVFLENSQPIGGFDIYVAVDSNYLHPFGASLGTLITNPSLTSICINGSAVNGTCTPNTANGPDVVECSTIESLGLNDAGTGLLCTITFLIVHPTPSTMISFPSAPGCFPSSVSDNICILIVDNLGNVLRESAQGANVAIPHVIDPTSPMVSCIPNPDIVGQPTTCIAMINDTATSNEVYSIGGVTFTTDGIGVFNPNSCILSQIPSTASADCLVTYTPLAVGTGITHICAIYLGDTVHSGSTGCTALMVSPASVIISTQVILDQTGFPINATVGVPQGLSVHDEVILIGGYPVTGVTGTVTYTLFPNSLCAAGTGTIVATVKVGPANNVPPSPPVTPAEGSWSFSATYNNDTANNKRITSPCEPFPVGIPPPFFGGKLHWTHHLSLSKSASTQSWTAIVSNPLSTNVKLVVRIVGVSTINPSLSFDVTCGVTCVNTAFGGVNFTSGLTPVTVAAGTSSTSFSFNQLIPGGFVNQKFTFTATLYWATGTLYTPSNSKSGAFAVVP